MRLRVWINDNRAIGMQSESPTNSNVTLPPLRSEAQCIGNAEKGGDSFFNFI